MKNKTYLSRIATVLAAFIVCFSAFAQSTDVPDTSNALLVYSIDFNDGNRTGWQTTLNAMNAGSNNSNGAANPEVTGWHYENWVSNALGAGKISYNLGHVPAGTYVIEALAFTNNESDGVYVYIGNERTQVTSAQIDEEYTYRVATTLTAAGILSFGLELDESATANWVGIDEVKVYFMGTEDEFNASVEFEPGEDVTSYVDPSWGATGYAATQYAPAVITSDGRTLQLAELYYQTTNITGIMMNQVIDGLSNGTYKVTLAANAMYTPGRGFDCIEPFDDGAKTAASVYANDYKMPIAAYNATETAENGVYTFYTYVDDGTLSMGFDIETPSINWPSIQCQSLIYMGTGEPSEYPAISDDDPTPSDDPTPPSDPDDDYIDQGTIYTCTWFVDKNGQLTIKPSNGSSGLLSYSVPSSLSEGLFNSLTDVSKITSVVVEKGVTTTANCNKLFASLPQVVTIDITNLNTENAESMIDMFYGCTTLTSIIGLENLNTSKVTNMSLMFSNCNSLKSIDLSNYTASVNNMTGMFLSCSSLTSIDLSNFNTGNVSSMSDMFNGCEILTSIIGLENLNTSKVTDMSHMFSNCNSLKSIDLSNFNTGNVSSMSGMFYGCEILTSIIGLENLNTSKVTDMSYMFSNCNSLKSIDLSNFDTGNVSNMLAMFQHCSSLTSIDLSNFNTGNVSDMQAMFNGCSALTTIDLSSFNTSNVKSMNYMFNECIALKSLNLTGFSMAKVTDMSNMFYGCNALTTIISDSETPTTLKDGAFSSLPTLSTCKLVAPVSSISAYAVADGWKDLKISDSASGTSYTCKWNISAAGVLTIEPRTGTSGTLATWTAIEDVPWHDYRTLIKQVEVLNTVKVPNCIGLFAGCINLTTLSVQGFDTNSSTSFQRMFSECSKLTRVDMSQFGMSKGTDLSYMFEQCTSLTTVTINNNTSNATTTEGMFKGCSALSGLDVSKLNTKNVTEMSQMFYGCSSLTTLTLTGFSMESAQRYIDLFTGCLKLRTIRSIADTPSPLKADAFSSLPTLSTCALTMPSGAERAYALADGWKDLQFDKPAPVSDNGTMVIENTNGKLADMVADKEAVKAISVKDGITDNEAAFIATLPNLMEVDWRSDAQVPEAILTAQKDNTTNANLLIRVPDTYQGTKNETNFIVGDVAENVVITDNKSLRVTSDFKTKRISYTRTFGLETAPGKSQGWETIILPFDVEEITTAYGATLAPFGSDKDYDIGFWLGLFSEDDQAFQTDTKIRANVPYVIAMPNSPLYEEAYNVKGAVTFTSADVLVQSTELAEENLSEYNFVASYENTGNTTYPGYFLNDQQEGNYAPGSAFVLKQAPKEAFRPYIKAQGQLANRRNTLPVSFGNGATGMPDVIAAQKSDARTFDLQGREVKSITKSGIYIRNGKKIVVK